MQHFLYSCSLAIPDDLRSLRLPIIWGLLNAKQLFVKRKKEQERAKGVDKSDTFFFSHLVIAFVYIYSGCGLYVTTLQMCVMVRKAVSP